MRMRSLVARIDQQLIISSGVLFSTRIVIYMTKLTLLSHASAIKESPCSHRKINWRSSTTGPLTIRNKRTKSILSLMSIARKINSYISKSHVHRTTQRMAFIFTSSPSMRMTSPPTASSTVLTITTLFFHSMVCTSTASAWRSSHSRSTRLPASEPASIFSIDNNAISVAGTERR